MLAMSLHACCTGPQHKLDMAMLPTPVLLDATAAFPGLDQQRLLLQQQARLAPDADPGGLALTVQARTCALRHGDAAEDARLAVIDYSKPST